MKPLPLLFLLLSGSLLCGAPIANTGFESGIEGWRFWTHDAGTGTIAIDGQIRHGGSQSAQINHWGKKDWSLEPKERLAVQPNEMFEMEIWVRAEGEGNANFCVSTWNQEDKIIDWAYARRQAVIGNDWQRLLIRMLVPAGVAKIQPRLVGDGKLKLWADDLVIRKVDSSNLQRKPGVPATLTIGNPLLSVTLNTSNATLAVHDQRNGRDWIQKVQSDGVVLNDATARGNQITMRLFHNASGLEVTGTIQLLPDKPEFTLELAAAGELNSPMRFPYPFDTAPGDYLVVPMNEGVAYPIEDKTVPLQRLDAFAGHGICMAFWGVTDGKAGQMAIIETPDDASIQTSRVDHRLIIAPEWVPQKQAFGYTRKLRYVFFDQGGHVAMAKRYRTYAKQTGLFKTLEEKRQFNPNVDLLVGAVNVWCWESNSPAMAKEMRAAGIQRILWSSAQSPEKLRQLNDLGVLTSRYDIYQDVMDPAQFPKLKGIQGDWTTAAWPNEIVRNASDQWVKGWGVEARDGSMIYCGALCDKCAVKFARERVPADLATHPYKCRFIDTTTASHWRECYDTNHPMTRGECKQARMQLLRYMSEDAKLVTGSETGHDAAVPFVHYFEGMLSLASYRVPDSGRRMAVIWTNVPEVVAKYQVGPAYRLPLWELVYHDCVVAHWYWGDYNNKLPAIWDKRDLFNVLYGTAPMFMFNRSQWQANRDRFVRSYQNTCPYVRAVGYAEMTDHRFLTPDRNVQQTVYANGVTITVNFGATEFRLPSGAVVNPMGYHVTGMPKPE